MIIPVWLVVDVVVLNMYVSERGIALELFVLENAAAVKSVD